MITDYHCRHCKSKCPPFRQNRFKIWLTTCPHCGTKYRIAGDSPVVEEVRKPRFESGGFVSHHEYPFEFFDKPEIVTDPEEILRLKGYHFSDISAEDFEKLSDRFKIAIWHSLLKRAEQMEQYERCAELFYKIKQLEK